MNQEDRAPKSFHSLGAAALKKLLYATDETVSVVSSILQDQVSEEDHISYCLGLMTKVLESYSAVKLLCQNGMGNCGLILTRVMFEDAIEMKYVADDPGVRLKEAINNELAGLRLTVAKLHEIEKCLPFKVDDIVSRQQQNFLKNSVSGRARRNTFDQACACKLEGLYFEAYSYACLYIHTTSQALKDYVKEERDVVTLGSFRQQTAQALGVAAISAMLSLETGLSLFGLTANSLSDLRGLASRHLPILVGMIESVAPGEEQPEG